MGTKFTVITRNVKTDKFWKRTFRIEEEAIEFKDLVTNGYHDKYEFVGLIKEKRIGHRWCLSIKNPKKNWKKDIMFFNSKKNCILASELIKKYNNDLITSYTKTY